MISKVLDRVSKINTIRAVKKRTVLYAEKHYSENYRNIIIT